MDKREMIRDLRAKREISRDSLKRIIERAKVENRSLTPAEGRIFDTTEADIRAFDDRIEELDEQVRADEAAAPMQRKYAPIAGVNRVTTENRKPTMPGAAIITREPEVYKREDPKTSFFMDMLNVRNNGDRNALERLDRNNRMVADRARANGELRAISTTNGSGGEFVPPMWLEAEFVKLARPRRVFADLVTNDPLPPGTDQLNLPKVNTGTATAVQTTQNSQIQQTDLTTTSISSSVTTVAGGQTVSLQLIEQSPLNIDDVILGDLAADYAMRLDTLCLTGPGTGGQPTGILTLAGTNSVAWSGTALTGANSLYNAIASAISKVYTSRYEAPDAIVMHPRRFMWMLAQQDTLGRPVIVPAESGPNNVLGVLGPKLNAEGPAGRIAGLDVYLDANIPTNLGTGTNEDRVLVLKSDDVRLWESHIRAEAFQQTYANQMSVFVRLYNYASFQAARYPGSISVISGTGLSQTL
ncbi:phage major capsid protein [Kitasatospora sp. HPMI-4]|uniref:phage major capsid protein n=1 Tax=Kitasatospora sp. HPMI-4 TaxID=3448443 RepID=UPI003F19979C